MALRKFLYMDQTEGYSTEQASADELSIGKLTLVGVGGIAVDAGGFRIVNVATPTAGTDATNKNYVDALVNGLDWKNSVRLATAAPLPAVTAAGAGIGKTLTANANGALSVDGVVVVNGDRILVKNQATAADNGIYTQTTLGTGGSPFVLTRAVDADENAEVTAGMAMFVEEGSVNADQGWVLITDNPITVDTTSLAFSQFTPTGSTTNAQRILNSLTASGSIASGDAVYWSGSNVVSTGADNGTNIQARIMGVAIQSIPNASAGSVVSHGLAAGVLSGATAGDQYWLSDSGQPTATTPGATKRVVRLGYAINATDLWVEIFDYGKKA